VTRFGRLINHPSGSVTSVESKIHWVVRCGGFVSGDCILEVSKELP